jgi:ABC-type multidrug transport system fused ATPase/permease subunit
MNFRHPWQVVIAIGATIVAAALQLMVPRLLGYAVDQARPLLSGGDVELAQAALWTTALILLGVSVARGLFTLAQNYFAEAVGHHAAYELRLACYEKLQHLSFSFHDRVHSGDLIMLGIIDIEGVRMFFSTGLVRMVLLAILIGVGACMATCESRGILGDMMPTPNMARTERLRYHNLPGVPQAAAKLFLIPFFIVHYGMFCFGHLTAVVALFAPQGLSADLGATMHELWQSSYWIAIAAIATSHLYSFATNFIGNGEYQRVNIMSLMKRPYGRIVAMHVAIILGGALVAWLGNALPMLLVLIVAKSILDLKLHERERAIHARAQ